jgi:hypothetical protein
LIDERPSGRPENQSISEGWIEVKLPSGVGDAAFFARSFSLKNWERLE